MASVDLQHAPIICLAATATAVNGALEVDHLTVGIAVALLCRAPTVLPAAMAVAALADRGVDSADHAVALVDRAADSAGAASMAEDSVVADSTAVVAEDSTAVVAVIANRYSKTDRDNGPL